jgi:hypothetical protein
MTMIDFEIIVCVGDDRRIINTSCDVMMIGQAVMMIGQAVRGRARRLFNHALKRAGKDVQVAVSVWGQQSLPPYTSYDGELGGVNGQLLRKKGMFEAW